MLGFAGITSTGSSGNNFLTVVEWDLMKGSGIQGLPFGSLGISLLSRPSISFLFSSRKLTTAFTSSSLRQSKDFSTVLASSSLLSSFPSTTAEDVDMNSDLKHLFHNTRVGMVRVILSDSLPTLDMKYNLNLEKPDILLSIPHAM